MKRNLQKYLCCILSVFMLFSLFVSNVQNVAAAQIEVAPKSAKPAVVKDIGGHWAEKQIADWCSKGIMSGYSDNTFKPDKTITRAEFMTLVNNVFGYKAKASGSFTDVKNGDWYYDELLIAIEAGYVKGYSDGSIKPKEQISRQEVAAVIANILRLEAAENSSELLKMKDNKSIAAWSKGAIGAVLENGYMKGYKDQTFKTGNPITRAEAAVALQNIAGGIYNEAGTYGDTTIEGNVSVGGDGVILKNMTIKGSLYLSEGIGSGTIVLDNVTVNGKTLICGGGMESIVVKNSTLGKTVVEKKDGKVRIEASGKTKIGKMELRSGSKLEEKDLSDAGFEEVEIKKVNNSTATIQFAGDFKTVDLASAAKIEVVNGNIGELKAKEESQNSEIKVLSGIVESIDIKAKVQLDVEGGKITNVIVDKTSTGTIVTVKEGAFISSLTTDSAIEVLGKGEVENAVVNVDGVKFEVEPLKIEKAKEVEVQIGDVTPTPASTMAATSTAIATATPTPSTGGNNGGSASNPTSKATRTPTPTTTPTTTQTTTPTTTPTPTTTATPATTTGPEVTASLEKIFAEETGIVISLYKTIGEDDDYIEDLDISDFTLVKDFTQGGTIIEGISLYRDELSGTYEYEILPQESTSFEAGNYRLAFHKEGYTVAHIDFEIGAPDPQIVIGYSPDAPFDYRVDNTITVFLSTIDIVDETEIDVCLFGETVEDIIVGPETVAVYDNEATVEIIVPAQTVEAGMYYIGAQAGEVTNYVPVVFENLSIEIEGYEGIDNITVSNAVYQDVYAIVGLLPTSICIIDTEVSVGLSWSAEMPIYENGEAGVYVFTAEPELPQGYKDDTDPQEITATVIVREEIEGYVALEDLTVSNVVYDGELAIFIMLNELMTSICITGTDASVEVAWNADASPRYFGEAGEYEFTANIVAFPDGYIDIIAPEQIKIKVIVTE